MCEKCQVGMMEEEQICPVCSRLSRYSVRHENCDIRRTCEGLVSFWQYEGVVKKLISEAKYEGYFDQLRDLTRMSLDLIDRDEFVFFRKFLEIKPVVVPVPLFGSRERERGFNQAKIIAEVVAREWRLDMGNLLVRVRDTGQQVGRSREERLVSVAEAFVLASEKQIPRHILVVDDVWTTGATLSSAVGALRRGGSEKVWGLVLAR